MPTVCESALQLDFTSALYLGFSHTSADIPPWRRFSTGRPAALQSLPACRYLERKLSELVGSEAVVLAPSTLHVFSDLFVQLAEQTVAFYLDSGVYPIVRWASERAAVRGVPVHVFPQHDVDGLKRLLARNPRRRNRPVIVTDAVCTQSGEVAPLSEYLCLARRHGGWLVFDDTQGLGILGHRPDGEAPYGYGGGGSWRWQGLAGSNIVSVASLAKAFGVPLAALCGTDSFVDRFKRDSETRVHCSPPSVPTLWAGIHVLRENRCRGDSRRFALLRRVQYFRNRVKENGIRTSGGFFPIQNVVYPTGRGSEVGFRRLQQAGVQTILREMSHSKLPQITFIITAHHKSNDIDCAVAALARAVNSDIQYRDPPQDKLFPNPAIRQLI